jgi:hypothetical protein
MRGIHWGIKSYYYSLINKMGSKASLAETVDTKVIAFTPLEDEGEEDCLACKL